VGALSVVCYVGVLVYAASRDVSLAPIVGILGGIGLILLLSVIVRRTEDVLAWSILLLGLSYVLTLVVHREGVDEAAPLVAAAMLLSAELAVWAGSERRRVRAEPRVVWERATAVSLLVAAGLAVSALVIGLAAAPLGGGLGWTLLGALSAVAVVTLATRLAR
jgi:hypothetical protein